MTLREIEETLQTLAARHPHLDEAMLVTLLRAGGWEEKQIMEALAVHRTGVYEERSQTLPTSLPAIETTSILPSPVDGDHLLNEHHSLKNEDEILPESLVLPKENMDTSSKEELPYNLPLRPFETSEHIWPFSRYRDVFFGDVRERAEEAPKHKEEISPERPVVEEKIIEQYTPPVRAPIIRPLPAQTVPDDDKLVLLAGIMLVVIIFLLTYMYSNGRL